MCSTTEARRVCCFIARRVRSDTPVTERNGLVLSRFAEVSTGRGGTGSGKPGCSASEPRAASQSASLLSLLIPASHGPGLSNKVLERCTEPCVTSSKLNLLLFLKALRPRAKFRDDALCGMKLRLPLLSLHA